MQFECQLDAPSVFSAIVVERVGVGHYDVLVFRLISKGRDCRRARVGVRNL